MPKWALSSLSAFRFVRIRLKKGTMIYNCESLQNIKKLHYMKKKSVVSSHHILSTKRNLLGSLFTLWLIRLDLQTHSKWSAKQYQMITVRAFISASHNINNSGLSVSLCGQKICCLNLLVSRCLLRASHNSCQELINSFCSKYTGKSEVA